MHKPYFLPARKLKLRRREDGSVCMNLDGQKMVLAPPKRSLPLTDPNRFILLYDSEGNEVGIVRDIEELEPASREVLQEALAQAYVMDRIVRVLEVERDTLTGQVRWRVEIAVPEDREAAALDEKPAADHDNHDGDDTTVTARLPGRIRLFKSRDDKQRDDKESKDASDKERDALVVRTEEREFLINGQEDIQTARYPHIYIVDIERNRYEILNCEELDIESRQAAERYF